MCLSWSAVLFSPGSCSSPSSPLGVSIFWRRSTLSLPASETKTAPHVRDSRARRMEFTRVSSSRDKDFNKKKAKKKSGSEEATGECSEVKQEEAERSEAAEAAFPPTFSVSEIKNKQRRHLMFMKFKQEKRKVIKEKGRRVTCSSNLHLTRCQ